ncbi:MAG: aldehyde ferredoxin oxidoreductase C-terminal domain-containing protein, partial [Anaerolineae bacterium]|nr:aldehyde ferredoxin oxidoreductase C-terminal domain-containing protein [Anaerolineae bacterium]
FGNADAMVQMVELMGERKGFGELLSEGSFHAAKSIGQGSEEFVMHSKGQEIPMHEPRVKFGLGVGYAMSPTGADHMHNFHDVDYQTEAGIEGVQHFGILEPLPFDDLGPGKMRLASVEIPWQTLHNSLGFCMFVGGCFEIPKVVEMVRAITGWNTTAYELLKVGERAYTMARAFNTREGITSAEDKIPARFFESFKEGPSAANKIEPADFNQACITFYKMMGWDPETGVPAAWKLQELGVGWVADVI